MENQSITIENKSKVTVSDIKSLDAFDDEAILANLYEGGIIIKGTNLHIENLDLDESILIAIGEIESITYTKERRKFSLIEKFKR